MNYKYPRISNTLIFKKISDEEIKVVEFLTEEEYFFNTDVARFIRKLDGYTNPYRIHTNLSKEEIWQILCFLEENELLRYSKMLRVSFGNFYRALWMPKVSNAFRNVAKVCNLFLSLIWLPVITIGVFIFAKNIAYVGFEGIWWGLLIGTIIGIPLHELGHLFAGVAYRARIFELGVMLMHCVIPGAYVMMDTSPIKKQQQKIQLNAAGIEMNFLLAGCFLILGTCFGFLGGMLMMAAIVNILLGILNLTFIEGLDGTAILSNLFGMENIVEYAKSLIFNKRKRKKITSQGVHGCAFVMICYVIATLQIVLPVLLITNVLEVLVCF